MMIIFGSLSIAVMVYAIIGLFFPKLRGYWKKGVVPMGACSSLGLALFFGGTGFLILPQSEKLGLFNSICALSANLGVALIAFGLIIDVIKSKKIGVSGNGDHHQ